MQSRKCEYCGVTQAPSTHKCLNCGGLLSHQASHNIKLTNKKRLLLAALLIILLISPFAYQKHIENTSNAILQKLLPGTIEPGLQTSTAAQFKIKARFTQALIEISPIKMLVTEHYQSMGSYPTSLNKLGLNESSLDTGELIQAVSLSEKGSIQIRLTPDVFGNNKTLTLTPRLTMGGMNMQWTCTSNLDRHLISDICKPEA